MLWKKLQWYVIKPYQMSKERSRKFKTACIDIQLTKYVNVVFFKRIYAIYQ